MSKNYADTLRNKLEASGDENLVKLATVLSDEQLLRLRDLYRNAADEVAKS